MLLMVRSGGTVWRTVMRTSNLPVVIPPRRAWNRGRIVGQKRPLEPKHVWAIRVRLELVNCRRDLALFNMAVESKLRGCDLVRLMVKDVFAAGHINQRTSILQSKTSQPVQFENTEGTRKSLSDWTCHGLFPHPVLVYLIFSSNLIGAIPPIAECLRREL